MMVVWAPYYCPAAMCCLSLPLLLLLLFCFCLCLCLLPCVGVRGHRRGTALGHPCGMPPTVVGLSVGMMAVRAVLYCCAVLLLPFVLLVYASTEVTKNVLFARKCSRILPTNKKICTWSKKCPSAYFGKSHISRWSLRLK